MTSTQIKKLNAYPEWNTLPTYMQALNYIQSINEDEEPQYPETFNNSQKTRYKQKFSKDFIVEPLNNQLTIFYQPHIQGQENQARAFLRQQGNYQISRPIKKAIENTE